MTHEYVGTKIITAWEQDKDDQPGYGVKYEDGYQSWSPKATFEAAYVSCGHIAHLPAHQQRVVAELVALDDRLDKLQRFFSTDMFNGLDASEQTRMRMQANAMAQYSQCLADRIGAFGHEL